MLRSLTRWPCAASTLARSPILRIAPRGRALRTLSIDATTLRLPWLMERYPPLPFSAEAEFEERAIDGDLATLGGADRLLATVQQHATNPIIVASAFFCAARRHLAHPSDRAAWEAVVHQVCTRERRELTHDHDDEARRSAGTTAGRVHAPGMGLAVLRSLAERGDETKTWSTIDIPQILDWLIHYDHIYAHAFRGEYYRDQLMAVLPHGVQYALYSYNFLVDFFPSCMGPIARDLSARGFADAHAGDPCDPPHTDPRHAFLSLSDRQRRVERALRMLADLTANMDGSKHVTGFLVQMETGRRWYGPDQHSLIPIAQAVVRLIRVWEPYNETHVALGEGLLDYAIAMSQGGLITANFISMGIAEPLLERLYNRVSKEWPMLGERRPHVHDRVVTLLQHLTREDWSDRLPIISRFKLSDVPVPESNRRLSILQFEDDDPL